MAKLKRLNRSDRAKHNAKLGDVVREISKNSGIIATKSGKNFVIDDGADAPIVGMKIYGRTDQLKTTGANLFDVHSSEWGSTNDRASAEVLEDGTIRVTRMKTGGYEAVRTQVLNTADFVGKTLYVKADVKGSVSGGKSGLYFGYENSISGASASSFGMDSDLTTEWTHLNASLTPTQDKADAYDKIRIVLYVNASGESVGAVGDYADYSNVMISTSDIEYEPYTGLAPSPSPEYPQAMNSVGEGGSVGLHIRGKQLFNPERIQNHSAGGAIITNNGDGSLTVSGSGALTSVFSKTYTVSDEEARKFLKPGKLYCKFDKITNPYMEIRIRANGVTLKSFNNRDHTNTQSVDISSAFEGNKEITLLVYVGYGATGTTIKPGTIRPLLWQDGDETYDEYREPKTATFPTPNGLLGIPVESGGNYTDVNGQQWICDEIDAESQKLIKRVKKETFTGDEKWEYTTQSSSGVELCYIVLGDGKNEGSYDKFFMCNYARVAKTSWTNPANIGMTADTNSKRMQIGFIFDIGTYGSATAWRSKVAELYNSGKPIEIAYALEEPIITPLTPKEITAYKTLKTHKPTTIVSNDAGAIVELSYYADKKNYIDQKFAELQALALENK